jgi:alginate O-acetyltransferase complex protein AlgI
MVFSSPIFLFLFLPAVLACTALPGLKLRNLLLLAFSLVIYAWGEVIFGSPMRAAFFRCRHRTGR